MCIVILAILGIFGAGIIYIQNLEMGWKGALLAFLLVGSGLLGVSMLAEEQTTVEQDIPVINAENATAMVAAFNGTSEHRWSILFVGGPVSGSDEIVTLTQQTLTKEDWRMVTLHGCVRMFGRHLEWE